MTPDRPSGRMPLLRRSPLSRLLAIPLLLAGAAGTALAAARLGTDAPLARWASFDAEAADTVPVFGPRRFEAGRGRAALHVERFAAPASASGAFVLRVVDGDGRGNGRVSALSLRVNGAEVATAASLARAGGTVDVPVALLAQNTVEASVEGPAGSGVSIVFLQVPEPSFTVIGPETVERAAGAPSVVIDRFALPAGAAPPYRLHVVNGDADGSARTSSAIVRVNGVQVIGTSDLSQSVGALLRDVSLAARNTVEVELRGAPGSRLTWRVTAMDTAAPVITLTAPPADLVTREAQVEVAGTVNDATPVSVTVNGVAAARTGAGFQATVPLNAEGDNTLTVSATDAAGNRTDSVRTVVRDTEAPALSIVSPAEGAYAADSILEVRGTVRDRSAVQANVNGVAVTPDASGEFVVHVPVVEGTNFLTLAATDAAGNAGSIVRQVIRDTRAPELSVTAPAEGFVTKESVVTVTGTATDVSAVTVTVNGVQAARDASGAFRAEVPLAADGPVVLRVHAADAAGNAADAEVRISRDTQAPVVSVDAPAEGLVTRESAVTVSGRVEDATAVTLTLNGQPVAVGADGGFTATVPLAADGPATLSLAATDAAGNRAEVARTVIRDTQAPVLALASPADSLVTRDGQVVVEGTATDATALTLTVNGAPATIGEGGAFRIETALAEGENAIAIRAVDAAGNEATLTRRVIRDSEAPVIEVTAPANGAVVRVAAMTVTGRVRDAGAVQLTINGAAIPVDDDGAFSASLTLAEGTNAIAVRAVDRAGNEAQASVSVILDTQAPVFSALTPADGVVVRDEAAVITGRVQDATTVSVAVNGVPATLGADGTFQASVALAEGETSVVITLTDAAGNEASAAVRIVRDSQAPVITVATPAEGATTADDHVTVSGSVQDATTVTLTVNGGPVEVGADGAFSFTAPVVTGPNPFVFEATDAAGNRATLTRTITREEEDLGLPPDPSRVASPIDPTVATHMGEAAAFLYTGANPVQTGVAPGTIVPHRTAVLRGRVLKRDGTPLPGVRVSVRGHPELGQTLSRRDGAYDLAVNGGTEITLDFQRDGYLPAQRGAPTTWMEFVGVEDVALIPLDSRVTAVSLGAAEAQVVRGSVVTDADGPRQATVLFAPGTQAVLEMPDGTTQAVPNLSIRLTEYTVGAGGRTAMPGELPGTSGYTYAVELSADEALAAGAEHARFTKPVRFYVDNFLEFPAGVAVPVAYYDRERAVWSPMDDGRVIRVLAGGGALAQVDVNGDGAADGDAALAALGIDATERAELARTYPEGASLWRMQTTHFSPFDLNYPAGPFPGSRPGPRRPRRRPPEECSGRRSGSVIECESRVLGEQLTVAGTDLTLNYRSDRVLGRGNEHVVPLTGDSIDNLLRVRVDVWVAGRHFSQEFDPAPGLSWTFRWDGLDAYGRRPQGMQNVRVRRTYTWPNSYLLPAAQARSFGLTCGAANAQGMAPCVIPASMNERARQTAETADEYSFEVNQWDGRQSSVAGWSLSDHHVYDPTSRRLYLGTGERRSATRIGSSIETIAGSGSEDYLSQNGAALSVPLRWAGPVAVAPDGTVYVAGWEMFYLARITRDGRVEHVAGGGFNARCTAAPCGDGGPLSGVRFRYGIEDLKFGPDGSLYIVDGRLIRKMTPDGKTSLVAGGYAMNLNDTYVAADGGRAVDTPIGYSWGVAIGQDGSVYFVESGNRVPVTRVRKVSPDGTIHTIAGSTRYPGNETAACRAEGIAATSACLDFATDVDVAPDGTVYVLEPFNRLMKVTPQGAFERVAGGRNLSCWGTEDGIPALQTGLCGWRMERHPDGRIFFYDSEGPDFYADSANWEGRMDGESRMRVIGLDGLVTTAFAGNGYCSSRDFPRCGDGGLARRATIGDNPGLAFGPDGAMYLGDMDLNRVRRIGLPFPGYDEDITFIASADGEEVYQLDGDGRHVGTRDARTGVVRRTFGYDGGGRLVSVTDEHGLVTRVERDGAGRVLGIVAPYGERTVLQENGDGYLAAAESPAGQRVGVQYGGAGGLMTRLTDAGGGVHAFAFDGIGRLDRDEDPAGGFQVVEGFGTRNCAGGACDEGAGATARTASGRTTTYWSEQRDYGATLREMTSPAGLTWRAESDERGWTTLRSPDGMTVTSLLAPDPRFGMDLPFAGRAEVVTPGGLRMLATQSRRAVLGSASDPFSLRTQTDSVVVNGRVFTTVYDRVAGQVTQRTAEGRVTVARLDAMGRVVESQAAGVAPSTFSYDALGRVTLAAQAGREWRFSYDARGRVSAVTDPLSRTVGYAYDDAGRVVKEVTADGREIRYEYDADGNLAAMTPAGRPAHRFGTGVLDLTSGYTPPGGEGGATRFSYNGDRELTRISRPDGAFVGFGYDAAGRLHAVTTPNGEIAYTYDAATGQVASVSAPGGSLLTYAYDGALPTRATLSGAVSGRIDLAYDDDLRVTRQTVNGGHAVDFRYDRDGLLTGAGALTAARHAQNGLLARTLVGAIADSLSYDALGQVSGTRATFGGAELLRASYTRDALGRITGLVETVNGETVAWGYTYDAAGRLETVTRDGAAYAAYEYDDNGNRLRAVTPAGVVAGEYDDQDRLVRSGTAEYRYGAAGDLSARVVDGDTTRYTYDAIGNLRRVDQPDGTRIEYLLDGQSRRVGKRVNGALAAGWLYAGPLSPVAQVDASGAVVARFVYATQVNVPDYMERDGRRYRILSDHRGSVRLVVDDATGQVAQRMDYDAWGRVVLDSNPGFQPFGFAGGLYDPDTRLVRFGARDYDPQTGRWTSKDPIGFAGGDMNLYGYGYGDPVNVIDPDGRCGFAGALGGALIGGGIDVGSQLWNNGGNLSCVSWRQAGGAAAMGGAEGGLTCGLGYAARAMRLGRGLPRKMYHYTDRNTARLIEQSQLGLPGRQLYLTPNGNMSPTRAQIELALPRSNTAEAVFEVTTRSLDPSLIMRRPVTGDLLGPVAGNVYARGGGGVELIYNGTLQIFNRIR